MGVQETFVGNISHGRWLKVNLHADRSHVGNYVFLSVFGSNILLLK